MGKHRDWAEIAKDYRETGLSLAQLGKKYGISVSTLKKAATRQGWSKGRVAPKSRQAAVRVKAALAEVEENAGRHAADTPEDPGGAEMEPDEMEPTEMEPAEMEPEKMEPGNGTKVVPFWTGETRVLPAETEAERFCRVVDEMMNRVEDAICNVDPRDAGSIKLLTAALKDLRSLKGLDKTELDREEQKARIEKLRSEAAIRMQDERPEITVNIRGVGSDELEEIIG